MLEKTEAWGKIVVAVQDRPLVDVAGEFGVTPGAITSALIRTKTRRKPVQIESAETDRPAAKPSGATRTRRPKKTETVNGLTVRLGTSDRAVAELADLLGVEPDGVIAKRAGVSTRTVATFRRANGIVGKRGRRPSKPAPQATPVSLPPEKSGSKQFRQRGKASKLDPYFDELGRVADRVIAAKAGVTPNAVAVYRRRRGIASVRDGRGAAVARPVPATTPPTPAATAPAAAAPAAAVRAPAPAAQPVPAAYSVASAPPAAAPPAQVAAPRPPVRQPTPQPAPQPAVQASNGDNVYRVERADGSFAFVVAPGLVGAAQKTEGHASIVAIRLLGEIL